jgi:hypothetical protein
VVAAFHALLVRLPLDVTVMLVLSGTGRQSPTLVEFGHVRNGHLVGDGAALYGRRGLGCGKRQCARGRSARCPALLLYAVTASFDADDGLPLTKRA